MKFYGAITVVFLVICTHTAAYLVGRQHGSQAERLAWHGHAKVWADAAAQSEIKWTAKESEWAAKVESLRAEIEAMRARPPEQIVKTERVVVEDRKCKQLLEQWRSQWNAN